jgi:hypothetical protein
MRAMKALFTGGLIVAASSSWAHPSDYYDQIDRNLIQMNNLSRQQGTGATWAREGDRIIMATTLPTSKFEEAYKKDAARLRGIMRKALIDNLCKPGFEDVMALGFSIVGRYSIGLSTMEVPIMINDCR